MATDDFYVQFGSNLSTFITDLDAGKDRIQNIVRDIKAAVDAGEVQARRGAALGNLLTNAGGGAPPPAGTGTVPTASAGDMASINSELRAFIGSLSTILNLAADKLAVTATRAETTSRMIEDAARAMKGLPARVERSLAARERVEDGKVKRKKGGSVEEDGTKSGGTFAKKVDPNAVVVTLRDPEPAKTIFDETPRTSISQVPTSMIDEAQFARLIDASKQSAKNSGKTVDRLDRLIAVINSQGTGGGGTPRVVHTEQARTVSTPTATVTTSTSSTNAPRAAAAAAAATASRPDKALRTEINQLKARIEERDRLAAVQSELNRAQRNMAPRPGGGGLVKQQEPNPDILARAARGSKTFEEKFDATGGSGQEYIDYLQNTRKSLQDAVKGIPNIRALRQNLADLEARATAAPAPSPTALAAQDAGPRNATAAANKRLNVLKNQIRKRERELALLEEQARLKAGGPAPSGAALARIVDESKSFQKAFDQSGGQGDEYSKMVDKALASTQKALNKTPQLEALRLELATALVESGDALPAPKKKRAPAAVTGGAEATKTLTADEKALFTRVNQIQNQIKVRERLKELLKARDRLAAGQRADAGDPESRVRLNLGQFAVDNPSMMGPAVETRIQKAIESAEAKMAKVKDPEGLERQLADAIAATGTPDGKIPKGVRSPKRAKEGQPVVDVTAEKTAEAEQAKIKQAQRKRVEALTAQRDAIQQSIRMIDSTTQLLQAESAKPTTTPEARANIDEQLKAVQKDRAEATSDLTQITRQLERAELKEAGVTRDHERAVNARAAKLKKRTGEAGLSLTPNEARKKLARLDLAGNKENLDALSAKDLFGLVEEYRGQGYAVPGVGVRNEQGQIPRTRRATMIDALSEANRLMATGEQETRQGLEQYRGKKTVTLKAAALKATRNLMGLVAESVDESLNSLRSQDYQGGGSGLGKGRRGKTDIAFGSELQPTGTPGGITRQDIIDAQGYESLIRQPIIAEAALADTSHKIAQHPTFNPYHPDLDVVGGERGSEVSNVRFIVNKLRAASDQIDKLGRAAVHAQTELDKMDKREDRLQGINKRLRDLREIQTNFGSLDEEQRASWNMLVPAREEARQDVIADRARRPDVEENLATAYRDLADLTKGQIKEGFFSTDEARQGLVDRQIDRDRVAQDVEDARLRRSDPTAFRVFEDAESFIAQRYGLENPTNAGSGKQGQRVEQTSLLGPNPLSQRFQEEFPNADPAALKEAQRLEKRLQKAEREFLDMKAQNRTLEKAGQPAAFSQEEIQTQTQLMAKRRSDLLTGIEKATGSLLPTRHTAEDVEAHEAKNRARKKEGLEPLPPLLRTFEKGDKAREIARVEAEVKIRREALAKQLAADALTGDNLSDPRLLLKRDKSGLTALERQANPNRGEPQKPFTGPYPEMTQRPATDAERAEIDTSEAGRRLDDLRKSLDFFTKALNTQQVTVDAAREKAQKAARKEEEAIARRREEIRAAIPMETAAIGTTSLDVDAINRNVTEGLRGREVALKSPVAFQDNDAIRKEAEALQAAQSRLGSGRITGEDARLFAKSLRQQESSLDRRIGETEQDKTNFLGDDQHGTKMRAQRDAEIAELRRHVQALRAAREKLESAASESERIGKQRVTKAVNNTLASDPGAEVLKAREKREKAEASLSVHNQRANAFTERRLALEARAAELENVFSPTQDRTMQDGTKILSPANENKRLAAMTPEEVVADLQRQVAEREKSLYTKTDFSPPLPVDRVDPDAILPTQSAVREKGKLGPGDPLENARKLLERSGIRMSDTMNVALNKAKTLPLLIDALETALKTGTIQYSQFLGAPRAAVAARAEEFFTPAAAFGPEEDEDLNRRVRDLITQYNEPISVPTATSDRDKAAALVETTAAAREAAEARRAAIVDRGRPSVEGLGTEQAKTANKRFDDELAAATKSQTAARSAATKAANALKAAEERLAAAVRKEADRVAQGKDPNSLVPPPLPRPTGAQTVTGPGSQNAQASAEVFTDVMRQIQTETGTLIDPRQFPTEARKASPEPELLNKTTEELFGEKPGQKQKERKAAATAEAAADATKVTASKKVAAATDQIAKKLAAAEKAIATGAGDFRINATRGQLAKAANLDQANYGGGAAGLQRLINDVRAGTGQPVANAAAIGTAVRDAVASAKTAGFDDDCCTKIVEAVNRVNSTLKSGLRLSATGAVKGRIADAEAGEAKKTGRKQTLPQAEFDEKTAELARLKKFHDRQARVLARVDETKAKDPQNAALIPLLRDDHAVEAQRIAQLEAELANSRRSTAKKQPKAPEAPRPDADIQVSDANDQKIRSRYIGMKPAELAEFERKLPADIDLSKRGTTQRTNVTTGRSEVVANEEALALATEMVTRKYTNQATAVNYLRSALGLTNTAAQELAVRLRAAVTAADLVKGAERGSQRDQRVAVNRQVAAEQETKRAEREGRRQAKIARDAADATRHFNEAMAALGRDARQALAALRAAQATGDPAKINAAQRTFYSTAAEDLAVRSVQRGEDPISGIEKRRRQKDIAAMMGSESGMGVPINLSETRRIGADAESRIQQAMIAQGHGNTAAAHGVIHSLFGGQGFMARSLNSIGTFLVRNFSAGLVFGVTNAMQDMVQQALETEATFVRISSALDSQGRGQQGLRTGLQQISTDYGVPLKDVYSSAAGMVGIFGNNEDLEAGVRVSAQLQAISKGALNAAESMKALSSVTTAYGLQSPEELQHIADVLTVIQDEMGVNIEDTLEGAGRIAGQAKMMGLELESTFTYVGAISKLTGQSGSAAGEQFSRILSQLQTGRGQAVLEKNLGSESGIGEALNTRNYDAALKILLGSYNDLTDAQRDNIAVTLGGQRQAAAINGLLLKGVGVLNTATKAQYANGEAAKRAKDIANTLNAELQILQQNFVNLSAALVRSGLLNIVGIAVKGMNLFLGTVNQVASVLNGFADENPFLGMLRTIGGTAIGALVAIKLLRAGLNALRGVAVSSAAQVGLGPGAARNVAAREAGEAPPRGVLRQWLPANPMAGFGTQAPEDRRSLFQRGLDRTVGRTGEAFSTRGQALSAFGLNLQATAARNASGDLDGGRARTRSISGAGLDRAGRGADRLGRALTGLNRVMAASAVSAAASSVAMGGLTVALTAGLMEWFAISAEAQEQRAIYKTQRDKFLGKTDEDVADEAIYTGPNREAFDRRRKEFDGAQGYFKALGLLANNTVATLSTGLIGDFRTVDEVVGNVDSAKLKGGRKVRTAISSLGERQTGRIEALDVPLDTLTSEQAAANVRAIDEATTVSAAEVQALRDEIQGSDLSAEQKEVANAFVDQLSNQINEQAARIRLRLKGLSDLELLTTSELDTLNAFTNTIKGAGASQTDFTDLTKALAADVGAAPNSNYERLLAELNGPQSALEQTETLAAIERNTLDALTTQLTNDNLDPEKAQDLGQKAAAALQNYESLTIQALQMGVEGATILSNELRSSGMYEEAAAALDDAIRRLDIEIARQTEAGDLIAAARSRADKRVQQKAQTDLRLEGGAVKEQELRATDRDPVAQARSEVRESKAALDAYEADFAENRGADAKALSEARIRYNNSLHAEAEAVAAAARAGSNRDLAGMVNEADRAAQEQKIAADDVAVALALYSDSSAQYAEAMGRQTQAMLNSLNVAEAIRAATAATDIARIRNPDANAAAQTAEARNAYNFARDLYGDQDTRTQSAERALIQADQAQRDQREATRAATAATNIARIAPNDTVGIAQARLAEAQRAQTAAAQFGSNSAAYQSATQAVIQAIREVDNALFEMNAANADLGIAIAEASGDRNLVARLQADNAERLYQEALQKAGGNTKAAPVVAANAGRVRAETNIRDTQFQTALDTLDFQQEMGEVTGAAAIKVLQDMLTQQNLTEEQRRTLRRKIKGLEDALEGQFNLGDIKVPTVYQVRRSIAEARPVPTAGGSLDALSAGTVGAATTIGNVTNNNLNDNRQVVININGGDLAKVQETVRNAATTPTNTTRSTRPRKY